MGFELINQCRGARSKEGRPIKGPALTLLFDLASYANNQNECWPSARTLAHDLNITERNARAMLKKLIAAGVLEIIGRSRYRSNLYRIQILPLSKSSPVDSSKQPLSKPVSTPDKTDTKPLSNSTHKSSMNKKRTSNFENAAPRKRECECGWSMSFRARDDPDEDGNEVLFCPMCNKDIPTNPTSEKNRQEQGLTGVNRCV